MKKNKMVSVGMVVLLFSMNMMLLTGCQKEDTTDRETIYQYSTIQALTAGDYDGALSVSDLLTKGDTGLGTFNSLNGEMTVLDGVCYQTLSDGSVVKADTKGDIPFACVTTFDVDSEKSLEQIKTVDEMKEQLNSLIDENANVFYVVKIKGTFDTMKVRSELSQTKPYKTLDEVMKTDQKIFTYEKTMGTVVGVYCPEYVSGINASGWHFHYLSDDHTQGGHILDVVGSKLSVQMDKTLGFAMQLPDTDSFSSLNIGNVSKDAVDAVEKGK